MRSDASSVSSYLAELPEDRRAALTAVRTVIKANVPSGIVETMNWGMIAYEVPLATFADTYNGKPLTYAALASQKNYMSVYLMGIYADDELRARFEAAYAQTGKRMDVGKSCVRFRTLDELPLDVIAEAVGALTVPQFLAKHESGTSLRAGRTASRKG